MSLEYGHRVISIIIPTRQINKIVLKSISIIQKCFLNKEMNYEINVISNKINDTPLKNCNIYYDNRNNAAISRNIGLTKSRFDSGIYIFIDDDIIIEEDKFNNILEYLTQTSGKYILAPYLTGYFLKQNFKFSKANKLFYSWLFGSKIEDYNGIQGKSVYAYNFSPIFKDKMNDVEWATGGFLIFNNFKREECFFEKKIFDKSYHLEDYFLTYSHFLSGIPIRMIPISFTHINLNNIKKTLKQSFYEVYKLELNRLKIFKLHQKNSIRTILKFKISLLLFYIYRLKNLKLQNFIAFLAVLSLAIWES